MDFEFDKEMDLLLRQAAREDLFAATDIGAAHLDADDVAAFVENAMPASARQSCVEHFANCDSCRVMLANFVMLEEADEQPEIVPVTIKTATKTSWVESFKKVFAVPSWGYAMAAMMLMLVGGLAFVALQSAKNRDMVQNLPYEQLAGIEQEDKKKQKNTATQSVPQPEQTLEVIPDARVEESPEIAASSELNANVAPSPSLNAEITEKELPPSVTATKNLNRGNRNAPNETAARSLVNAAPNANGGNYTTTNTKPDNRTANANLNQNKNASVAPPVIARSKPNTDAAESVSSVRPPGAQANNAVVSEANKLEIRVVSGKTFQKIGGVWTDSATKSAKVETVSRSSAEFQKLDAGLRSIVNKLSGAVVVVWQGKTYRFN